MNKMKKNNKGQEEMVGFALIIVVVSVILLIFLAFSLRNGEKESVESYEVDSFIQSFLQYTTDCRDNLEALSIQDAIFSCNNNEICIDGRNSCDVLNSTLSEILKESWPVGAERPVKGYDLIINSDNKSVIDIKEGQETANSKGSIQPFSRGGSQIDIIFTAYYE